VRPPRASREPFAIFLQWLSRTSPDTVAKHYVETFDLRRRCALYLTYYQCGDTRKRGMAMLAFKTAYRPPVAQGRRPLLGRPRPSGSSTRPPSRT
jgi:nitrate reductase molybdenum cofactor assembly chaperone